MLAPNVSMRKRKVDPDQAAAPVVNTAQRTMEKRVKSTTATAAPTKSSQTRATGAAAPSARREAGTETVAALAAGSAVEEKVARLEAELADSLADNERLTMDVEKLQAARWEAERALKARREEIEKARDEGARAAEANSRLEEELGSLRAKVSETEALLLRRCTELAEEVLGKKKAIQQNDELQSRVTRIESELQANYAAVEELRARGQAQEDVRRRMHETIQELKGNIRVFCRVRPALAGPTFDGGEEPIIVRTPTGVLEPLHLDMLPPGAQAGSKPQRFKFDRVFPENTSQERRTAGGNRACLTI